MPNWKKVIVSGSDASLNTLNVVNGITGSLEGTASYALYALTASYALTSGGGGGTTEGKSVIYTTATSSTTWSFDHNLGSQYITYDIYDSNNKAIIPQNVTAVSDTTLVINFSSPVSGHAVATLGGGLPAISASYANYILAIDNTGTAASWIPSTGFSVTSASYANTASYVLNAVSASYANTASYVLNAVSASYAQTSISSSYTSTSSLATNVVGTANRILFNNAANTTATSNNLTWTDSINLLTLGDTTGTAGTISKLALYTSSFGGYGLGVSPAQLDYVSDGSHVFYKNGTTPTELVRISNVGVVTITGSLDVTSGITGSLFGTSTTASYSLTASKVQTAFLTVSTGSTQWTLNHNFGNKFVFVQVYDSNDDMIIPSRINLTNSNTTTIYFGVPTSGSVIAIPANV